MIDNFRPRVDLTPKEYSDYAEYSFESGEKISDIIQRYIIGDPQEINFVRSTKKVGCKVEDENIWLDFVINNDGSQTVYYWLPNNTYALSLSDLYEGDSGTIYYNNVELSGLTLDSIEARTGYSVTLDFTNAVLGQNCTALTLQNIDGEIIGLSELDVSNIESFSMDNLDISYVNISNWDLSNASSINITEVDVDSGNIDMYGLTVGSTTDYRHLFGFGTNVVYNLDNWTFTNMNSLSGMFDSVGDWTGISLNGLNTWDVSDIIHFDHMFSSVELDSLDVSGWDLTNSFDEGIQSGYYIDRMFGDAHIDDLYLTNWIIPFGSADGSNNPFHDFQGTIHVDGLTFSSPQGSTSYGISYLFCSGYYLIDGLDTWDVSDVVNIEGLFSEFHGVQFDSIIEQLEDWDVSSVTNFDNAFYNIENLTDFSPLDSWRNIIDPTASFNYCMYSSETVTDIRYPEWNGWFTTDGTFIPYTQSQYVNGILFKGIVDDTRPSNPQVGWAITDISTEPNKYLIYNGSVWSDTDTAPPDYIPVPVPENTYWWSNGYYSDFYPLTDSSVLTGYHVEVFNAPEFGTTTHLGYYLNDGDQYVREVNSYIRVMHSNMYWKGANGVYTDLNDLTPTDGQQALIYTQTNETSYLGYYTYNSFEDNWTL